MYVLRKAVFADADSGYCIEPEDGEVSEVVLRERFVLYVGVYAPQPPERFFTYRIIAQERDDYLFFVAYDGCYDRAGAVYYDAQLPFCLS